MSTHPFRIIKPEAGGVGLKTRKLELGTKNLVGARVTQARLARGMKQIELRTGCENPAFFVKSAIFLHIVYKCFTNPAHKGAIISIIETKRK